MAIAPITGSHIRRTSWDIVFSLSLGSLAGSYYWFYYHKPLIAKREDYYASLTKEKEESDA